MNDGVQVQRYLTTSEVVQFLTRHPIVAARVYETKAALDLGLYDFEVDDKSAEFGYLRIQFPGIIIPQGLQVQDARYGLVLIQPVPDGRMLYSGWTAVNLHTEQQYESPTGNPDWNDMFKQIVQSVLVGVVVVVVVNNLSKRKSS